MWSTHGTSRSIGTRASIGVAPVPVGVGPGERHLERAVADRGDRVVAEVPTAVARPAGRRAARVVDHRDPAAHLDQRCIRRVRARRGVQTLERRLVTRPGVDDGSGLVSVGRG